MKTVMILYILFMLGTGLMALTSTTNSVIFALDTLDPEITIQSPNGGEEWYIGDTHDITWTITENHPAANSTNLWYNRGGVDNVALALEIENTGTWTWALPDTLGSNYKIRIGSTDLFGNNSLKSSAGPFTITYITYVSPDTPDGVTVDISNNVDAVISWQPVTQTINGIPIIPDGYIVLYNETPYEDNDHFFYYLWDVTNGTTFTHGGVASRRDQMYYRVVAYKDIDGRMAEILAEARAATNTKLSFADIKAAMQKETLGGVK
ncbi:MAG: hypothetical protein PHO32_07400 [Candidatus Cloacimonetes bacterium]|nr:hypothetical protein [Candidatus Cloacimonadota bacterium]